MPSLDEVLKFREAMYQESVGIIKQKGHDYNRKQQMGGDTLFNLKVAALLGIVESPAQGILVRLSDKFMRLISLMAPNTGEPAVKGESVRDTVKDAHNYLDYALQLWEEEQQEQRKFAAEVLKKAAPMMLRPTPQVSATPDINIVPGYAGDTEAFGGSDF